MHKFYLHILGFLLKLVKSEMDLRSRSRVGVLAYVRKIQFRTL